MHSIPNTPRFSPQKPKCLKLAASAAAAVALATTAYGQYMPTNTMTFDDIAMDKGQYMGATPAYTPAIGLPDTITASWNGAYGFIGINDFNGAYWSTGGPASGNTNGFDCVDHSKLIFSSPVIIWKIAALRTQWATEFGFKGSLAGQLVWQFRDNNLNNVWQEMTAGAGRPIDTLEFIGTDWDTRYTDIELCDASGAPAWAVDPITSFDVTANSDYRNQTANSPVQLTWAVDPAALTITLTNNLGEVLDAYDATDWSTGMGSLSLTPTNTATYTLAVQNSVTNASMQLTVRAPALPSNVGFLTFEDLDPTKPINASYNWNAPAGVQLIWNNWSATGSEFGAPKTANDVFPNAWPVSVNGDISTNSLGGTNNAILSFTDAATTAPVPVIVNSFMLGTDTNNFQWWGPLHIEGRLAGVVQWTFDGSEAVQWQTYITKGAGLPIDEMDFQGQWYQYDNFSLSTNVLASPIQITSTAAQNGQLQFSWNSVADWANYVVFKKDTLIGGWYQWGMNPPAPAGTTSTFSDAANSQGFYRVLRVP